MIIFEITFGMVLVFFLSIIVLGYSLFSSLSAIIFVGGSVGVIGLGIYMAGKQMIYAFREKKFVWLLYGLLSLFLGIFLPYVFYACIGCLCKPIDIASIAGPLIALIIMTILNAIETGMMEDDGGTIYHFIGIVCIMLALVSFTSLGVYQKWSEKKLALGINKNVKYTVDETCFPLVEERVMYASENSGETVRLPYWIGNVRYPFAMFKAGEEVYEIKAEYPEEYEWVGMKKNGDRRYEDCVLVCSSEKKVLGYIPKSKFVGFGDEDILTTVKKDAIGQTFFDDNYEKSYLVGGERAEGIKITFLDDQKLSYTYGLFMCSVSEKGANWIEEEIYEEGEYEYEFSISSLEEVSLKFQGKSYEVGVHTEDNTISNIIFFPR